jgi:hypothetical protein
MNRYNRRVWLRPVKAYESKSSIIVKFNSHDGGEIILSDCSGSVEFSFSAYSDKKKKQQITTLRKLAKELADAADWYEANVEGR